MFIKNSFTNTRNGVLVKYISSLIIESESRFEHILLYRTDIVRNVLTWLCKMPQHLERQENWFVYVNL